MFCLFIIFRQEGRYGAVVGSKIGFGHALDVFFGDRGVVFGGVKKLFVIARKYFIGTNGVGASVDGPWRGLRVRGNRGRPARIVPVEADYE